MRLDIEQVVDGARLGPLHWRVLILTAALIGIAAVALLVSPLGDYGAFRVNTSLPNTFSPLCPAYPRCANPNVSSMYRNVE